VSKDKDLLVRIMRSAARSLHNGQRTRKLALAKA
jgi:hypothetical protein